MKPGIRDQHQISCGINRKPCRQRAAGPEMQKDRNQDNLLGYSQYSLQKIGRPSAEQPVRPIGAGQRRNLALARRFFGPLDQDENLSSINRRAISPA